MSKSNSIRILVSAIILCNSCHVPSDARQGQPYVPYVTDQVITNTTKVLKDGEGMSFPLGPGKYKLELTANNDGADAEWIGGGCPRTKPVKQTTMTCEMPQSGQLIITNPTTFGLGASVSVTVKVTKLAN